MTDQLIPPATADPRRLSITRQPLNGDYDHVSDAVRATCQHPRTELGVVVTSSGVRQVYPHCTTCGRKVRCPNNAGLPIIRDNRTGQACERCGRRDGVEEHHWAPRALFEDFDQWPTASLCTGCHRRWHAVVTPTRP